MTRDFDAMFGRIFSNDSGPCLSCGKKLAIGPVCNDCARAGREFDNLLSKGLEIEYIDGTKEIIKS